MKCSIHPTKGFSLTLMGILVLPTGCKYNTAPADKPNILFIAVDDLRLELNCYGASHIQSPNIDRIASNGILFTNAHVQQAISMASRASVLTGYRPERHGIYTGESVHDLLPEVRTLNRLFEQNGYSVAAFGKIYHFPIDHQTQFGERHTDPVSKWAGRGYLTDKAVEQMRMNEADIIEGRNHSGRGPAFEWADVPDSAYIDGYITELALRKLNELRTEENPFFLAVGFHKPHLPFVAPQKYWDMYPRETIELSGIRDVPENSNQYTFSGWGELRNYYGIPKYSQAVGDDTTRILRQGYFACVSYVDALVGKLIHALEQLDLKKNTIIVLWGDHGYKLGDYGTYWGKWSNMDIDTRVPMIISVPGSKKGKRCGVPVETLDIYPTLAALCGLPIPDHVEGRSLVSLLDQPDQDQEAYVYSIWPHNRTRYNRTVMGYSVKTARFNYTEWVKLGTGEVLGRELYDHENDPAETRNIIDNPEYADLIAHLAEKCMVRKETTDHDHVFRNR